MFREIFIIGIGGQGALTIGEILLIAANKKNYAASFYPFYGSQMRGGEAGCIVKIDTDGLDILNPTVNSPDDFIILNDKFFDKYRKFANDDSKYYETKEVNNKNLNLLMLKQYIEDSAMFDDEVIIEAIKEKFKKEEVYSEKIKVYNGD